MKLSKKREEAISVEEIDIISKAESVLSNKIKSLNNILQSTNINVGAEFFESIQTSIDNIKIKKEFINKR